MSSIEELRDLIIYQSQNNENISVEVLYDEDIITKFLNIRLMNEEEKQWYIDYKN